MVIVKSSATMVNGRLQVSIDLQTKGDLPGHPFRGNQWDGGGQNPQDARWESEQKIGMSRPKYGKIVRSMTFDRVKVISTTRGDDHRPPPQLSDPKFIAGVIHRSGTKEWASKNNVTIMLGSKKLGIGETAGTSSGLGHASVLVDKHTTVESAARVMDHEVAHERYAKQPELAERCRELAAEELGKLSVTTAMNIKASAKYGAGSIENEYFAETSARYFQDPDALKDAPKTRLFLEEAWSKT